MSRAAAKLALAVEELAGARAVHLYLPMEAAGEMDTSSLAGGLMSMEIPLMVPVIEDEEKGGGLVSVLYRPGMPLVRSRFGSPEPLERSLGDEYQIDAVVVPVVSVDRSGYRLGYGKGFYDRFFAHLSQRGIRPCRIGFGFSMQLQDSLPRDPWDEPLDLFVDENAVMRFNSYKDKCMS
jgi:5-formyltetrahydrofolate cyclo-ligase